ncbi:MAG: GNAT family N-acetyltransferase [Verrucomicrobiota bacterium]
MITTTQAHVSTPSIPIQTIVGPNESSRARRTTLLAFAADPAIRWLYPDAHSYTQGFPRFVDAFVGPSIACNTSFHIDNFQGVAYWLPPNEHADDEVITRVIEETVPRHRLREAFALFEQMDDFHPKEEHWYLPLIAVEPAQQNQGLGSALLKHTLTRCDRSRTPAYLESSSATNIPLYEKHGFRLIGEIQTSSSPIVYPMFRKPQFDPSMSQ